MALTLEQSVALQEAIDNLNQSVEINKEVLEIVKSVGNTGAVDIGTHNTDKGAHPSFNNVTAIKGVYVSPTATDPTNGLGGSHLYYNNNPEIQQLVNRFNLYGSWGNNNASGSVCLINGFGKNDSGTSSFAGKLVIGANAYGWEISDGEHVYHQIAGINLGFDADSKGAFTIGLNDASFSNAINYKFQYASFINTLSADLGSSVNQWKDCYLQNSPIVSSDRRLKQNFESVPEAVFSAWGNVNFQVYKFKEAVAKKGEANARKHVGLVAQDIIEAFQAQGLDAFDYGIVCHDSWEDQYQQVEVSHTPAVLDEQGNVVTPENTVYENELVKPAGDVYTVRYEEALALEAAYQRWKLGKIEAALAAKGITL